jgi:hypothetical protein
MEQKEIWYKDVVDLGFKIEEAQDEVYFAKNGFHSEMIEMDLTNDIFISWTKEDRKCMMYWVDGDFVKAKVPINDLDGLKDVIEIFKLDRGSMEKMIQDANDLEIKQADTNDNNERSFEKELMDSIYLREQLIEQLEWKIGFLESKLGDKTVDEQLQIFARTTYQSLN